MPTSQFSARDETVCYARLSMLREDPTSIDRQVALTTQEALKRGTRPVVFSEEKGHRSGRSEKYRPKFKEARDYVQKNLHKVKFFAVQDKDRVSRNALERLSFLKWLRDSGVEFVSILEPNFEKEMPASQRNLMETMSAGVAQHYADFIAEKMQNHIRYVQANGGIWGKAPYGLKACGKGKDRKFVPSPDGSLAEVVKLLTIYVSVPNVGLGRTAALARAQGIQWRDQSGNLREPNMNDVNRLINRCLETYRGLVDDSLYNRVVERREQRRLRKENGRRMQFKMLVLWRLLFCAECGARLSVHNVARPRVVKGHPTENMRVGRYYVHRADFARPCQYQNHYIRSEALEAQVWNDLTEFFVLSDKQKKRIAELAATPPDNTHLEQRKKLERRLRNLEIRYLDDEISKAEYIAIKADIEDNLSRLPADVPPPQMSTEEAIERLGSVIAIIRSHAEHDPEEINAVLKAVIQCIYVKGDQVTGYMPREWCKVMFPPNKITDLKVHAQPARTDD